MRDDCSTPGPAGGDGSVWQQQLDWAASRVPAMPRRAAGLLRPSASLPLFTPTARTATRVRIADSSAPTSAAAAATAQPSGLVEVWETQRAWLRAQIDPVPPLDVSEDFV